MLQASAAFGLRGMRREFGSVQTDEELVAFVDLRDFRTEMRASNPRVRCFDLRRLISFITPEREFFSFHQTETVQADSQTWRLRIDGFVEREGEFTLEQLKQRSESRDEVVTLECSGNAPGPGANGQVGNGRWSGVSLAPILAECGVKPEAREVVFFGMDMERSTGPDDVVPHGRSIYVQDAMSPLPMLAYELNGKPLPAEQGFPLRLIFPGCYGMTQIKWLNRIHVLDRRYEGFHMSRNYHTMNSLEYPNEELWLETSISKTRLKSVVARVTRRRQNERFLYRIAGAAWGGPSPLKSVEVQVDNGGWRAAQIAEPGGDFSWHLWSIDWPDASPGRHTLVSRAIDADGRIQPTAAERRASIRSNREDNSQWPRQVLVIGV